MTKVTSKQLLPIYDKPLIFYPISTLMLAGINDILIITTPDYIDRYKILLDHFSKLGKRLSFKTQDKPEGIAQAFILAEEFIKNDDCMLILGDNLFLDMIYQYC